MADLTDETRIIFQGLCGFLNLSGQNGTMGEPAVIGIRADGHAGHDNHRHVAYIAIDTSKASVSGSTQGFVPVPTAKRFSMLEINEIKGVKGVELVIDGDPPAQPVLDPSYDELVVRKDDYWPAAKDKWNRAMVPQKGNKPDKNAVAFYMKFGSGTIMSGAQLDREWGFKVDGKENGAVHKKKFAREVWYTRFKTADDGSFTLIIKSIESGQELRRLTFSPRKGFQRATVFIGNNTPNDLDSAMFRHNTKVSPKDGKPVTRAEHFEILNQMADLTDPTLGQGPIPELVGGAASADNDPGDLEQFPGGGFEDGFCGPVNGNK